MKPEHQLVSFKLSKKLKKLGFKQDSLWYWVRDKKDKDIKSNYELWLGETLKPWEVEEIIYSAYTVAELGEMLPVIVTGGWIITAKFTNGSWETGKMASYNLRPISKNLETKTEADARAKALIHLTENKLINPKKRR